VTAVADREEYEPNTYTVGRRLLATVLAAALAAGAAAAVPWAVDLLAAEWHWLLDLLSRPWRGFYG
jgi:hypothetical protein